MPKKRTLSVVLIVLLFLGALTHGAPKEAVIQGARELLSWNRYAVQVSGVRQAFAAERTLLNLSNASGAASTPEADLGEPPCTSIGGGGGGGGGSGATMPSGSAAPDAGCAACSKGTPVWMVNMVNFNFYMTDTPLWYRCPIGPSVEIKLSYNALLSSGGSFGSFGNKWQLNYGSYLYRMVNDAGLFVGILVVMPDGKRDFYAIAGGGLYTPPYHTFNTLTELATNHFELKLTDGRVYVYNVPSGTTSNVSLLVEIRNAYGQKLTMGHDADGRLTTVTDALGKVTTLSYNADGLVIQAADPFGRSAAFEYDGNRNLSKITDMGGYWAAFTYRHHVLTDYYLASLTNALGTWGFYFEPATDTDNGGDPYPAPGAAMGDSARITITNPSGGKEEYYRSGSSAWHVSPKHYLPYTSADSNNYASDVPKTVYGYSMTTPRRGEVGGVTSPEGNVKQLAYDHLDIAGINTGNVTGLSDGVKELALSYNALGKVTSLQEGTFTPTTLTYAANGIDLTQITDGLGTVAITYNNAHDVTAITDRLGHTRTITYNAYGQITALTDEGDTTTSFSYNANHLLTHVTSGGQTLKSSTYDAIGRIRTDTDATGMTRTYEYSDADEIVKITYPDGKHLNLAYAGGIPRLITGITDRGGRTTQYAYNASKQIDSVLNPAGGVTRFNRDADGNLIGLVDANDNVTAFDHDHDNRPVKKTFADGSFVSYTYDQAGSVDSYTNARNQMAFYVRNAAGAPAMIFYNDLYTLAVMYHYDTHQRRIEMTDDAGTHVFTYDAGSRLTGIDGPLDDDTIALQYDAKGRITGYTSGKSQSVAYAFDGLDRPASVAGSAGTFTYDYAGPSPLVQKLTRPNGSYTQYQYDGINRLTGVTNKTSAGVIINEFIYTYNEQDQRAGETVTNGPAIALLQAGSTAYSYNSVNALLNATNPNQTFAHDADGNLTQGHVPAGYAFTATYDFENRLTSMVHQEPCTWQGQALECEHQTQYTYNGDGLLAKIRKQADLVVDDTEVFYVRFGHLALQERDADNTVTREYTWATDAGGGIGQLLGLKQGGQHYFYLYDGKGNVTAIVDAAQTVVAAYAYDPFGRPTAKTGTLDQPYRFSTKPYDEETGLSYYGYRFYASQIGRWMTRDPIGEAGGIALYEFARNNPANLVDPMGLDPASYTTPTFSWWEIFRMGMGLPAKSRNDGGSKCSGQDSAVAAAAKDKWLELGEVFVPVSPVVGPVKDMVEGAATLAEGLKVEKKYFDAVCAEWTDPAGKRACEKRAALIR